MNDEPDILDTTPPAGIPGALFSAMLKQTLSDYKPGTTIVTDAGASQRASRHVIALLELMTAFYEEAAAEETSRDDAD
jgi:hypothetical protein